MNSVIEIPFIAKAKAYLDLTKFRLNMTVVFSACFGYILASTDLNIGSLLLFALSSYMITGSANSFNQIIERNRDVLMSRTKGRPLPTHRLTVNQAITFAIIVGIIGLGIILTQFNFLAFLISLLSLILYSFVYTPLKSKGPVAVPVGAIPGAFPPMIGWVAYTGAFGWEPGILFAIQFFWQFPHFWAISWVAYDDYAKAGYFLLPSTGGKDLSSAIQIMTYTLFLLPLCWVPYYLGMTGINSAVFALVMSILFLAQTFYLMREKSKKAALRLMFGSFFYLPIVQLAYLFDKI